MAIRCRVSSDVDSLQALHEATGWTPSAEQIRPTAALRAQKELMLANISRMWVSPADLVCYQVFGGATTRGASGLRSTQRPPPGRAVLVPQPFPYDLAAGTAHMVLWCSSPRPNWSDEQLTAEIVCAVDERWGGSSTEFIWYENPKMSVPDPHLYHVQVFCRPAGSLSPQTARPSTAPSIRASPSATRPPPSQDAGGASTVRGDPPLSKVGRAAAARAAARAAAARAQLEEQLASCAVRAPTEVASARVRPAQPPTSQPQPQQQQQAAAAGGASDGAHAQTHRQMVSQLVEMGFPAAKAGCAVVQADGSLERACALLLEGGAGATAPTAAAAAAATASSAPGATGSTTAGVPPPGAAVGGGAPPQGCCLLD